MAASISFFFTHWMPRLLKLPGSRATLGKGLPSSEPPPGVPPVPVLGVGLGLEEHPAEPIAAVLAHQAVGVDTVGPVLPHQARCHLDLGDGLAVQQLGRAEPRHGRGWEGPLGSPSPTPAEEPTTGFSPTAPHRS